MAGIKEYPLYNNLVSRARTERIPEDALSLTVAIAMLPDSVSLMEIYSLILHHATINGEKVDRGPPYGGAVFPGGKGIVYKAFATLPADLQKILYVYMLGASRPTPVAEMKVSNIFA